MSTTKDLIKNLLNSKVSPFRQSIHKWRARRDVPFRKKFFIGYDLDGNTFWELKNHNNPGRMRRMVEPRDPTLSLSDYKLAPQWIQWLRHTRPHYPTLEELVQDQIRQARLKGLVQEAEKRWKAIPLKSENAEHEQQQEGSQQSQLHSKTQRDNSEKDERTPAKPIVAARR